MTVSHSQPGVSIRDQAPAKPLEILAAPRTNRFESAELPDERTVPSALLATAAASAVPVVLALVVAVVGLALR